MCTCIDPPVHHVHAPLFLYFVFTTLAHVTLGIDMEKISHGVKPTIDQQLRIIPYLGLSCTPAQSSALS